MTPVEDFFKFNPPSRLDFQSLWHPPSRENFQNPIRRRGVNFFWNNPIVNTFWIYFSLLRSMFEMHTAVLAPSVRELAKMKFKAQTPFLSLQNRNWRWSQRTSLAQDSCGPEFPVVYTEDLQNLLGLNFRIPRNFGSPHLHVSGGFEDRGITQ